MSYFIGVDGGGTKTQYALFDESKNILLSVKGPGTNHENYEGSFDEASNLIWQGLTELLDKADLQVSDISFTLMGLAGIDHPFQYDAMRERLENFGLKNFEIFNDGFIVVKAGASASSAIGYNCGTGTCCNAVDDEGTMLQLAGLGDFSGDVGNGHWIALKVFNAIYDELFLFIHKTEMTKLFLEKFGIKEREEFLGTLENLATEAADDYIRTLIDIFFIAANNSDPAALELMEKMAERGAQLITTHEKTLKFNAEPIEVILSGSIHTKLPADKYIQMMAEKTTAMSNRKFIFKKLEVPPVVGCINWIFQEYV